jgi:hypothetical protein
MSSAYRSAHPPLIDLSIFLLIFIFSSGIFLPPAIAIAGKLRYAIL